MNELDRKQLRDAFMTSLPMPAGLEWHLRSALEGVLMNPGSMVRPEVVYEMGVAYGLGASRSTELAVALEYFHTASLVFDDLPSMDDALERRGVPCAHVHAGEGAAILGALALINRAYALTWHSVAGSTPAVQQRALAYLEKNLGVGGLLHGQSLDLHYATLPHDRKTTAEIACGKTVALIRLTLVMPALLGGASDHEVHLLERIAMSWGLSYQIVDDLKDVLQSAEETGKTALRDLSMDRPNIALVIGVPDALERLQRLLGLGNRLLERLIHLRPELEFLAALRTELGEAAQLMSRDACEMAGGGVA